MMNKRQRSVGNGEGWQDEAIIGLLRTVDGGEPGVEMGTLPARVRVAIQTIRSLIRENQQLSDSPPGITLHPLTRNEFCLTDWHPCEITALTSLFTTVTATSPSDRHQTGTACVVKRCAETSAIMVGGTSV